MYEAVNYYLKLPKQTFWGRNLAKIDDKTGFISKLSLNIVIYWHKFVFKTIHTKRLFSHLYVQKHGKCSM